MPNKIAADSLTQIRSLLKNGDLPHLQQAVAEEAELLEQALGNGVPSIATTEVYVASTGSDISGDGSITNPYATIARGLRDKPSSIQNTPMGFRVLVKAPYTGLGFQFEETVGVATSSTSFPYLSIESYADPTLVGTVNDPRWTISLGPITSTGAGSLQSTYPTYTVATGSVAAANIGRIVRIFRAGVEVGRCILADILTAGSDTLYLVQGNIGAIPFVPTSGDVLYFCEPAVVITSGVRLSVGYRAPMYITNIRFASASPIMQVINGTVRLAGCQLVSSSNTPALTVSNGGNVETFYTTSTTALPWLSATERAFTTMAGAFIFATRAGYAVTAELFNGGQASLAGSAVENIFHVHTGGVLTFNHWQRGQVKAASGGSVYVPPSTSSRGVLGGARNNLFPGQALYIEGANLGTYVGSDDVPLYYVPEGYSNAGSNAFVIYVRRALCKGRFQVNGLTGAGVCLTNVVNAESFAEIQILTGNITGTGADVRAGATTAAFAGLPIVDASTLTRVTNVS